MAERLDSLPKQGYPPRLDRGSKSSYPWDEWFDGTPWAIRQGEDYRCRHRSFQVRAYSAAAERRAGKLVFRALKNESGEQIGWAIQFSANNGDSA